MDGEAHALTGQCDVARRDAVAALELSRDNFTLERANRAFAICGLRADAEDWQRNWPNGSRRPR